MLRVLLVAPTIDAADIGEAWVSYQWASRLSERFDVTVLSYSKRGSQPVAPQLPQARVVEWVEPPVVGRAERINSLLKPGYLPFYHRARRWIESALRAGERFDVGHQPTPVAMRYPSPLAGFEIPFVIGPVGGSLDSPPGFGSTDTAPWYVGLRRLDSVRLRRDPLLRRTYADARCVLGIAPYAAEALASIPLHRFEVMSETALDSLPTALPPRSERPIVRLLFVGRVIRTKGARDLVAALAHLRDLPIAVDIVGGGFDEPRCRQLAEDLTVMDRVEFHGAVPHERVDSFYRDADVFVFPSYREPGGNVVFEAMGHGLPLVVCDRGGPAAAVDDSCALTVTPESPEQFARGIADAVRRLATNRDLRLAMGAAARSRVEEIGLWSPKIDRIGGIYADIAGGR